PTCTTCVASFLGGNTCSAGCPGLGRNCSGTTTGLCPALFGGPGGLSGGNCDAPYSSYYCCCV
ncbi:unnamed protein product, partial [Rotaria sp. Silwood1]